MAESETYRTKEDADAYFANQLYATDWTGASDGDKDKALLMASRAVDSLKYKGVKRSLWEALRDDGGDITTPSATMLAATELTELEIEAANNNQIKKFPRDDERNPEAWKLVISATGGTYTLTLNSETTSAIAYDANAAAVETALEALTSISAGDVVVTGTTELTITMAGDFEAVWFNTLTSDATLLTGGSSTATITVVEDNVFDAIFYAVCEEAKELLAGRDPQQEFRNLQLTTDGIGSNRVSMDRSEAHPEHTQHQFASPLAWKYLQRYLGANNHFTINRR